MSRLSGFAFRIIMVAALAVAAIGAARAEERYDGVTLRVATFGGPWRDLLDKQLSPRFAALGGKLEFVTGSPQANFAKLVAGRGRAPFDVVELLDAQVPDYDQGKYLAPIDLTKIPNKQYLEPYQYNDKMVASWLTQEALCYNTEKFKQLGLAPLTTYKDLAQPALAGHVMIPDINSGGGLAAFGGFAIAAGGSEANFMPGVEVIKSIKGVKFWTQGDQVTLAFQSGDIYAAAAHAGWCLRTKNAGVPVQSVHPVIKPGVVGVAKQGWLGIIATSKNIAASHWFIDQYLEAETQLAVALDEGVVPVNRLAIAKLGEDATLAQMLQLTPELISHELRIDYSKANISDWIDAWNRMISR